MIQAIKNIPLAFFSRSFYIDLLRRSTGIGMRFIFILVLIDISYMAIMSFSLFHEGINVVHDLNEMNDAVITVCLSDDGLRMSQNIILIIYEKHALCAAERMPHAIFAYG